MLTPFMVMVLLPAVAAGVTADEYGSAPDVECQTRCTDRNGYAAAAEVEGGSGCVGPANRYPGAAPRSGENSVADIPVHEFEPCTRSAANVRVRVTQGQ